MFEGFEDIAFFGKGTGKRQGSDGRNGEIEKDRDETKSRKKKKRGASDSEGIRDRVSKRKRSVRLVNTIHRSASSHKSGDDSS